MRFRHRYYRKMWLKGIDPKDPSVSPLYADVSGFPKTLLLAASNDILTPYIMKYYEKLEAAGVDVYNCIFHRKGVSSYARKISIMG